MAPRYRTRVRFWLFVWKIHQYNSYRMSQNVNQWNHNYTVLSNASEDRREFRGKETSIDGIKRRTPWDSCQRILWHTDVCAPRRELYAMVPGSRPFHWCIPTMNSIARSDCYHYPPLKWIHSDQSPDNTVYSNVRSPILGSLRNIWSLGQCCRSCTHDCELSQNDKRGTCRLPFVSRVAIQSGLHRIYWQQTLEPDSQIVYIRRFYHEASLKRWHFHSWKSIMSIEYHLQSSSTHFLLATESYELIYLRIHWRTEHHHWQRCRTASSFRSPLLFFGIQTDRRCRRGYRAIEEPRGTACHSISLLLEDRMTTHASLKNKMCCANCHTNEIVSVCTSYTWRVAHY